MQSGICKVNTEKYSQKKVRNTQFLSGSEDLESSDSQEEVSGYSSHHLPKNEEDFVERKSKISKHKLKDELLDESLLKREEINQQVQSETSLRVQEGTNHSRRSVFSRDGGEFELFGGNTEGGERRNRFAK